ASSRYPQNLCILMRFPHSIIFTTLGSYHHLIERERECLPRARKDRQLKPSYSSRSLDAMTAIAGASVAVTGAASGIGRALAIELAARGADLALADRDEAGLSDVAAEIAETGNTAGQAGAGLPKVTLHRVDVGAREDIASFAREAVAAHPSLNIVINNAGVALLGQFHEIDQAQIEWLFNINFWGVVNATRAFLPQLSSQPAAHIVNISSIFGIVAPPGNTAYAAAKFAVRGFSESLRHELQAAQSPVRL